MQGMGIRGLLLASRDPLGHQESWHFVGKGWRRNIQGQARGTGYRVPLTRAVLRPVLTPGWVEMLVPISL